MKRANQTKDSIWDWIADTWNKKLELKGSPKTVKSKWFSLRRNSTKYLNTKEHENNSGKIVEELEEVKMKSYKKLPGRNEKDDERNEAIEIKNLEVAKFLS